MSNTGMFHFALAWGWILMYTSWNAAFAYGVGFAWSFRLVLLIPVLVALYFDQEDAAVASTAWLGARTYSLGLNQALRGAQFTYVFKPGASFVTKPENAPTTNDALRLYWGAANLALVGYLYIHQYL